MIKDNSELKKLKSGNEWGFLILAFLFTIVGLIVGDTSYFILAGISLILFRLTEITRRMLK